MNIPEKIDLHMHTTVSDGTDTPLEILKKVREAGITFFSVTDHDAVKGSQIIKAALTDGDPRFISGAEFSCRDEEGKYHILGYHYDPEAPSIQELIKKGHDLRITKVAARVEFIKTEFGFSFSQEDIDWLFSRDNPGKPHIAALMEKYGYAKDKKEAFQKYLNKLHFKSMYIRPEDAVMAILQGGGIPVLAHPPYGDGDQNILDDELKQRVKRLMHMGIKGMECFYSQYSPKMVEQTLSIASEYHLYVTAGSDYHGANKSMIRLAENGLDEYEGEIPEGLLRFLEDTRD